MTSAGARKAWETRRARMGLVDPNSGAALTALAAKLRRDLSSTGLATLAQMIGAELPAVPSAAPAPIADVRPPRKLRLVKPAPQPAIVDYPMPKGIDRRAPRGPSLWANFADGEIVRMTFSTQRGKPTNVGLGLRLVIGAYRSRRRVQRRAGYGDYSDRIPIPEFKAVFVVKDFTADVIEYETVDAEAANAHTAALRQGETTRHAKRMRRELAQADAEAFDREGSRAAYAMNAARIKRALTQLCLPAPSGAPAVPEEKQMTILPLTLEGDFYEARGNDARNLARVLGLVLLKDRKTGAPMCGFMKYRLDEYTAALAQAGYQVEIKTEPQQ